MIHAIKNPCQISDFNEAKLQKVYECCIEWFKMRPRRVKMCDQLKEFVREFNSKTCRKFPNTFWMLGDFMLKKTCHDLCYDWDYNYSFSFCSLWRCSPKRSMAFSFQRFLGHAQRRITVSRTLLQEWSARRRYLYLTPHNTYNKVTSMSPAGS
jgi:hypothetical protein